MIGNDEFQQRYSGRYFGKYRGKVTRIQDPRHGGRLMLKVPVVMGFTEELGWALPQPIAGGGQNTGDFNCPEVGDYVWVEFEEGDPSRPIWSPGPWGMKDGESMLPKHSRGAADDTDYAGRGAGVAPPTQFQGSYGSNRSIQSRSGGGFLEIDETDGEERVQLSHRTGTRIEMTSDGSMQEMTMAGVRRRVGATHKVEVVDAEDYSISGKSTFLAGAPRTEEYQSSLSQTFEGDVSVSGRGYASSWRGGIDCQLQGSYNLQAAGQGNLMFGGALALMIRQALQMTAVENMEISASNSLGLPTANAVLLHGYNGKVEAKSTDATGLAGESSLILDGTPGIGSATLLGGTGGGTIVVKATPLSNVLLGGLSAIEPMVLGTQWQTFMSTLLGYLIGHTHPTGMGPSGPSVELASQLPPEILNLITKLSTTVMGL